MKMFSVSKQPQNIHKKYSFPYIIKFCWDHTSLCVFQTNEKKWQDNLQCYCWLHAASPGAAGNLRLNSPQFQQQLFLFLNLKGEILVQNCLSAIPEVSCYRFWTHPSIPVCSTSDGLERGKLLWILLHHWALHPERNGPKSSRNIVGESTPKCEKHTQNITFQPFFSRKWPWKGIFLTTMVLSFQL